jgi:transposase
MLTEKDFYDYFAEETISIGFVSTHKPEEPIIEANNDATLEELSELLYEKTQVKVSRATLVRLTQKLNYSFKKKHYTRRKKKVTGYSKKE